MKRKSKALGILAFAVGLFSAPKVHAQLCAAQNTSGCTSDYLAAVIIKNAKGQTVFSATGLNCANTGNASNYLMNAGNAFDVTYGDELEITLTNTPSFQEHVGIWVDVDRDNNLSASECIAGPSGVFATLTYSETRTAKVKVPCGTGSGGKSYLRIRCMYSAFTTGQGCGTQSNWGNIMDFEINLIAVSTPVADFTVPTTNNYVKTPISFFPKNPSAAYSYNWTYTGGTPATGTGSPGVSKFNTAGTYDVKMVVSYCGYADSIIKSFTAVKPTAAPVANFVASAAEWEESYNYTLYDLSTNGAHTWNWEVTGPIGMSTSATQTFTTKNPNFALYDLGDYDVCLTAINDIGPSSKVCKSKYIKVIPPTEYVIGPQKEAPNKKGRLYDNGGPTGTYANSSKVYNNYFKIVPCGAKFIELTFTDLKLQDGNDKIHIFDGDNGGAPELLTISGTNQSLWIGKKLRSTGYALYITFESDASGNNDGFVIDWDSDLSAPKLPKAGFTPDFNPNGTGVAVEFTNTTTGALGIPTYTWLVDQNEVGYLTDQTYQFTTSGTYEVCVIAQTCAGNDTFCRQQQINTPTKAGFLDFTASTRRPTLSDVVTLKTSTDYASRFIWSIYPTTFSYVNGTSSTSRNPQIRFTANGCYTFTLKAWNEDGTRAATENTIVKNKYVCAVDACSPVAAVLSSDIGISKVELRNGSNVLISNLTDVGVKTYSDYTADVSANIDYCGQYTIEVARGTNSNPINYKAWIDFNIDGDFDDAGEEILSSGQISGTSASATFSVPALSVSFEGKTKMRVASSFGNYSNTPCGINLVGEYEDYTLYLIKDNVAPVITLIGGDTVYVEKRSNSSGCYTDAVGVTYTATDNIQGSMTSAVTTSNNIDCSIPGIYTIDYKVCDCSDNCGYARRYVYVVLDRTPPTLTLNGKDTIRIEQCGTFNDPGAYAYDLVDGDLTKGILVDGKVDNTTTGQYKLTYRITDAQGNESRKIRVINVMDTTRPHITLKGNPIVNGMQVNVPIGQTFVDEVICNDACNGLILYPGFRQVAGFTGPVDGTRIGEYTVTYYATDIHGNLASENGYTVIYKVNDYIAPAITFTTGDTIYHDVNTPYKPAPVLVSDNYYEVSDIRLTKTTPDIDAYTLNTYVETWRAIDASNNISTKSRIIKVVDRQAPVINGLNINACVGVPFWAMSGLQVTDNYYSSAQLLDLVKVVSHNVNIWEAGLYTINYQVTDPSNNTSSMFSRYVMVNYPPNCQNSFASTTNSSLEQGVKLYPVPSKGLLNVAASLVIDEPVQLQVFNALGQLIYTQKGVYLNSGAHKIDLTGNVSGVYTLRISTSKETVSRNFMLQ